MPEKVELEMYLQNNASVASQPGVSSRTLQFQSISSTKNAALFTTENGHSYLMFNNPLPTVAAKFAAGAKYKVTIEPLVEAV